MANAYLMDTSSPYWPYQSTVGAYHNMPLPTGSAKRPQYDNVYMDDITCLTKVNPSQQPQVYKLTICASKDTYTLLPHKLKDLINPQKALTSNGNWYHTKEILGWIIDTKTGTNLSCPSS